MHPDDMPKLNQKLSFAPDAMRTCRHGMVSGARGKPNSPTLSFVFANTQHLAKSLAAHPRVPKVYYPGLTSHPQHELAKRQMKGFGGIVGFEVEGGREAA